MRAILAVVVAFFTLLLGLSVMAQEAPVGDGYSLQPANGDYLKIDRRTGDVSHCAARDGVWSCQLIPEDRKAYEDHIADLENENDHLRKQLAELEAREKEARPPLFDETDKRHLQEMLDFGDLMFRHFFDLVDRLRQRDEKPI